MEIINDELIFNTTFDKPVGAELDDTELKKQTFPLKLVDESDQDSIKKFERNKLALDAALAKRHEGVTRYGRKTKPVDRFE